MFRSFRVSARFLCNPQISPILTHQHLLCEISLMFSLLNSLSHNANKNITDEKTDDKKKLLTKTNLYFIIVSTGNEQRLVGVKIHPTNGPVVFVESVDQRSHSVVPQLHDTAV